MTPQRRDQLRLLVRVLFALGAAVLILSLAAAIQVGTSESSVPGFDEITQQNRGTAALAVLGGGVLGAGILLGIAGILTVLVEGAPPAADPPKPEDDPGPRGAP